MVVADYSKRAGLVPVSFSSGHKPTAFTGWRSASPYYQHVIRALSNFSQHSQNTHHLINIIPKVLAGLELVTDKMIENHSLSMLIHLLIQSPEQTSQLIISVFQCFMVDMFLFQQKQRRTVPYQIGKSFQCLIFTY
ncbi:hypothetical protein EB796_013757 [Bugula neritina]|uniref:Uncharacterized protein n=1 Tax=Bugula neritina TaxID=10212 RepID=A0A7J7JNL6_BUGNE|nr:hypothetical protein EB796_013757 [Bugula neritina]